MALLLFITESVHRFDLSTAGFIVFNKMTVKMYIKIGYQFYSFVISGHKHTLHAVLHGAMNVQYSLIIQYSTSVSSYVTDKVKLPCRIRNNH